MKLPTRASKAKKIFENIISSSKLKTYLTVPLKDNSNNLQEPSVYFSDLLKSSESENLIDLSNYLFFDDKLGQRIKSSSDGNCPNSSQTNNLVVWIPDQVRDDKAQVRDDKAQVRNDGYRVNPETLNKLFKRYLGTDLTHPITPTRLEAIAECRFRAYVEKLLRVEVPREKGNDTDVLWLGNLAHEVLEKFYKTRQEQNVAVGNFDSEQRELLNKIYQEVSDKHIKSYVNPQREILNATVNWLKDSLFRLISNLEHDIAISGVRPRFFELKAGYDKKLSFMINNQEIYFGGIIDRIDWSVGQRVVIDYKTSSKANIVSKIAKSNLMTKHFQLPLYLRLVENIWPSAGEVDLFAYLVSIKGAGVSRVLGVKDDEFRERVLDDSREDGLFFGLKNILEPLLQGNIDFSSGPHCDFCQLNRVCRKND